MGWTRNISSSSLSGRPAGAVAPKAVCHWGRVQKEKAECDEDTAELERQTQTQTRTRNDNFPHLHADDDHGQNAVRHHRERNEVKEDTEHADDGKQASGRDTHMLPLLQVPGQSTSCNQPPPASPTTPATQTRSKSMPPPTPLGSSSASHPGAEADAGWLSFARPAYLTQTTAQTQCKNTPPPTLFGSPPGFTRAQRGRRGARSDGRCGGVHAAL
ncbi:hypothetical protein DFH06DRAFT_1203645 [Mycena polygramma]|nr:hypothetical protein DFH06DRAFT_1203645 [Mycena polygramma]